MFHHLFLKPQNIPFLIIEHIYNKYLFSDLWAQKKKRRIIHNLWSRWNVQSFVILICHISQLYWKGMKTVWNSISSGLRFHPVRWAWRGEGLRKHVCVCVLCLRVCLRVCGREQAARKLTEEYQAPQILFNFFIQKMWKYKDN